MLFDNEKCLCEFFLMCGKEGICTRPHRCGCMPTHVMGLLSAVMSASGLGGPQKIWITIK